MADDIPNAFGEIGQTGLERQAGEIYANPLKELRGRKGRKLFQEMAEIDPVVGALLFTIDMLMRQVPWNVEPGEDTAEGEADSQFVDTCFKDTQRPFKETVSEILSMLTYGWDFHETVFKLRQGPDGDVPSRFSDNKIGWDRFAPRSQLSLDKWFIAENGDILGWNQQAEPDFKDRPLPLIKGMLFRTTTKNNNPEGRSILQNAYRPWYIKKNLETIQAIGIERDLAGLPVLGIPPEYLHANADQEKQALLASMKTLLRNIRRDEQEGIIVPLMYDENNNKMFELTLMSTGGRRQFDTKAIIQYYDSRIAMTAMADFILLGHEIHGSFALSDNKTEILAHALGAYMDVIADQFNKKAIPQLLAMNGRLPENPPQLVHGDVETLDLGQLGTYIQQLAGARVLSYDEDLENHLRRQADIPEREKRV